MDIEIEQIRIIINDGRKRNVNGTFVPFFQDAALSISRCTDLTGTDLQLIYYILGTLDEKNACSLPSTQVAEQIGKTRQAVRKSIKHLIDLKYLCVDEDRPHSYLASEYLLNPRIAYKGNTKDLVKTNLPLPITSKGLPLIPGSSTHNDIISSISFEEEHHDANI